MSRKICWVVSDEGKIGTENQCIGLAESLGYTPIVKRIKPRFPWSVLPPQLWVAPLKGLSKKGDLLTPPWPDLIIGAGRLSVAPTAAVRRLTKGTTKVIQLQNPRVNPKLFDAIVAPLHDKLSGKNVISTVGALHRVTWERLAEDAKKVASHVDPLGKPLVAVLIGGSNACYQMTPEAMTQMARHLKALSHQYKAGLAITFSRRTEQENREAFIKAMEGTPAYIWNFEGENPYFGLLGLADFIVVTCDSVSMTSEACFPGKPVYVYPLPGGSKKFKAFHRMMVELGYTRPFDGTLRTWGKEPLDEFQRVRAELSKIIGLHS